MSLQQELFDKVAIHLLTQNKQSVCSEHEAICLYRVLPKPDDKDQRILKCAIGALIDDKFYNRSLENKTFYTSNFVKEAVKKSQNMERDFTSEEINMLSDLQVIHDHRSVEYWYTQLSMLATKYKLSQEVLNDFIEIY